MELVFAILLFVTALVFVLIIFTFALHNDLDAYLAILSITIVIVCTWSGVLLLNKCSDKKPESTELSNNWNEFTYTYSFEVVDAKRIDGCTYQVGLKDQDGYYFSLTQDLVKFAAMNVNVNQILGYDEGDFINHVKLR